MQLERWQDVIVKVFRVVIVATTIRMFTGRPVIADARPNLLSLSLIE